MTQLAQGGGIKELGVKYACRGLEFALIWLRYDRRSRVRKAGAVLLYCES